MSKTITDLNAQIEELEKRIKAISTSHYTLAQIIAVRDSLDQVKICLNELNHTLANEEDDASASELSALAQRVTLLEESMLAIETDLSSAQDDIADLQTDISTINSNISEQNTSITNLQSAQTSLQATQTNLQASLSSQASQISTNQTNIATNTTQISNLDSRLATAETQLASIDTSVTTNLDTRLSEIENDESKSFSTFDHKTLVLHLNCSETAVKSRPFYYRANKQRDVLQKFTLNYTSSGQGTLTINLYENQTQYKTFVVDLQENPDSFSFEYEFFTNDSYQNYQFEASSTTPVTFKNFNCKFYGVNVQIFEHDEDIKIRCMNETIYVTKYIGSKIKFGKFGKDNFTVSCLEDENLPYELDDINEDVKITYASFCGALERITSTTYNYYDVLVLEKNDGQVYYYNFDTATQATTLRQELTYVGGYEYYTELVEYLGVCDGYGTKHARIKFPSTNYIPYDYNDNSILKGKIYDIVLPKQNYLKDGQFDTTINHANAFFMYQDGQYMYNYTCTSELYIKFGNAKKLFANQTGFGYGYVFAYNGKDMDVYYYNQKITYKSTLSNCSYACMLYDKNVLVIQNGVYDIITIS